MGQAQRSTAIILPQQAAFNAACDALKAKAEALGFIKVDAKAAAKEVAQAQRVARWAAFDLMQTADKADWSQYGQSLALELADAAGIEGKSRDVYAMRGRDMATFADHVRNADREKADPFTVAKKAREAKLAKEKREAENSPFAAEAREHAMGVLGTTVADFDRVLNSDTADGQRYREVHSASLALIKSRSSVLDMLKGALNVLAIADDETKAKAKELIAIVA